MKTSVMQKILLVFLSLFLTLVLLEAGLRIGGFVLLASKELRNKASISKKSTYRILCLGESTTFIGGKNSWPSQLEEILNQQNPNTGFSVINKGMGGISTGFILAKLEGNLHRYKPDIVITMVGINDVRGDIMPYKNADLPKPKLLLNSIKTYRLGRLLYLHIKNEIAAVKNDAGLSLASYLGWRCYLIRKDRSSEIFYKLAVKINPKDSISHMRLGWLCRTKGDFDKAKEAFKKAIAINANDYFSYKGMGCIALKCSEDAEAEKMFKKAIAVNAEHIPAYIHLGKLYTKQKRYSDAESLIKSGIVVNPQSSKLFAFLSSIYKGQGKHKLYNESLKKAEELELETYNESTTSNYQTLAKIVLDKDIKLMCMQYPNRSIEPLKKMLQGEDNIIFIENKTNFKRSLSEELYNEYFIDMFAGDFGHCTKKGNRLIAQNVAEVISNHLLTVVNKN